MKTIIRTAIIALSIAALLVPATALAAPGAGSANAGLGVRSAAGPGSTGASAEEIAERIRERVATALARRAQRFNEAVKNIERRMERVEKLADRVEDLGGDVEQVRAQLRECEQLLTQAREEERVAAQLFKAVPDATDRRGAFAKAREQARLAVRTMHQSRVQLREAAAELRDVAQDLTEDGDGA